MNARVALHVISAVLGALTGGAVIIPGIPDDIWKAVVAVAGLALVAIQAYMGATTTGLHK